MNASRIIRAKRDGRELEDREIEFFVRGFVSEEIAPYQVTAFLMAVFFRGMTPRGNRHPHPGDGGERRDLFLPRSARASRWTSIPPEAWGI